MSWRRRDRSERSDEVHGIGEILDVLLAKGALAKGRPLGTLAGRWAEVVGPKLAAECVPVALEGRVLTLAVSAPGWAAQLNFLAPDVARKANEVLGSDTVGEVRTRIASERPRKSQNRRSEA